MANAAAVLDAPLVANCLGVDPTGPLGVRRVRWGGSLIETARVDAAVHLLTVAHLLRGRHRPISSWTVLCPVCGVDCTPGIYPHRPGDGECPHRDSVVTDVPVVEVLEAARELLRPEPGAS